MKVLDTSAILACLFDEPGGVVAREAFEEGFVSSVNLAETVTKLVRNGTPPSMTTKALALGGLEVIDATRSQAINAGQLAKHNALSLGDRFCIALAQELELPVLTADRIWANLGLDVPVELIR